MILYHGLYIAVAKPDISFSRENVDFGRGFYTTPIKEQAISWPIRFKRKHSQAIVSLYEFDDFALQDYTVSVLDFETYSDEWLDFIISSRNGKSKSGYDIVIGGVANDKVFDTVQLFMDGLIDKAESIKRLRYEKPNVQYCFRNQAIIDKYLNFLTSEVL